MAALTSECGKEGCRDPSGESLTDAPGPRREHKDHSLRWLVIPPSSPRPHILNSGPDLSPENGLRTTTGSG